MSFITNISFSNYRASSFRFIKNEKKQEMRDTDHKVYSTKQQLSISTEKKEKRSKKNSATPIVFSKAEKKKKDIKITSSKQLSLTTTTPEKKEKKHKGIRLSPRALSKAEKKKKNIKITSSKQLSSTITTPEKKEKKYKEIRLSPRDYKTDKSKKMTDVKDSFKFSQLLVTIESEENRIDICSNARLWSVKANGKYLKAHGGKAPNFKPEEAHLDHANIFQTSKKICHDISISLEEPMSVEKVIVCRDTKKAIQAIAIFNSQSNTLKYLATHPENIRHEVNKNSPNVQGAGTSIVLYLAKKMLEEKGTIRLKAIENAVPFYKKLQFELDPDNEDPSDRRIPKHIAMKLSSEKIKELIDNEVAPFNQLK